MLQPQIANTKATPAEKSILPPVPPLAAEFFHISTDARGPEAVTTVDIGNTSISGAMKSPKINRNLLLAMRALLLENDPKSPTKIFFDQNHPIPHLPPKKVETEFPGCSYTNLPVYPGVGIAVTNNSVSTRYPLGQVFDACIPRQGSWKLIAGVLLGHEDATNSPAKVILILLYQAAILREQFPNARKSSDETLKQETLQRGGVIAKKLRMGDAEERALGAELEKLMRENIMLARRAQ